MKGGKRKRKGKIIAKLRCGPKPLPRPTTPSHSRSPTFPTGANMWAKGVNRSPTPAYSLSLDDVVGPTAQIRSPTCLASFYSTDLWGPPIGSIPFVILESKHASTKLHGFRVAIVKNL